MKLYQIVPGLYVRGHIRRIRNPKERYRRLKNAGINAIFAVVTPYMKGTEEWVDYRYYPIADGQLKGNELGILDTLANDIARLVKKRKNVIVYCKRGRNRSCFLAALAVRKIKNITGREALKLVRKMRPNSLANKYFAKYLRSLEKP